MWFVAGLGECENVLPNDFRKPKPQYWIIGVSEAQTCFPLALEEDVPMSTFNCKLLKHCVARTTGTEYLFSRVARVV